MWIFTTSPSTSHDGIGSWPALRNWWMSVKRHSKVTGLRATLGTWINSEATASSPASSNSFTSGGTAAQVWFMASASSRVARFHTNSPVSWMLRTVSFQPMLEKPMMGGT